MASYLNKFHNLKKFLIVPFFLLEMITAASCTGLPVEEHANSTPHPIEVEKVFKYFDKNLKPPKNLSELEGLVHLYIKDTKRWSRNVYWIKLVNQVKGYNGVEIVLMFLVVHKDDINPPDETANKNATIRFDGGKSVMIGIDPKKKEIVFMFNS